jgi:hypothetical protein
MVAIGAGAVERPVQRDFGGVDLGCRDPRDCGNPLGSGDLMILVRCDSADHWRTLREAAWTELTRIIRLAVRCGQSLKRPADI